MLKHFRTNDLTLDVGKLNYRYAANVQNVGKYHKLHILSFLWRCCNSNQTFMILTCQP